MKIKNAAWNKISLSFFISSNDNVFFIDLLIVLVNYNSPGLKKTLILSTLNECILKIWLFK